MSYVSRYLAATGPVFLDFSGNGSVRVESPNNPENDPRRETEERHDRRNGPRREAATLRPSREAGHHRLAGPARRGPRPRDRGIRRGRAPLDTGHIPGGVKVDWHTDLQDPVARDYLNGEGFAKLLSDKGIARHDTIVFYGDNFNWWAAYALWVFSLFGHHDVRLLDGGRTKWIAEGRPITTDATSRPA